LPALSLPCVNGLVSRGTPQKRAAGRFVAWIPEKGVRRGDCV